MIDIAMSADRITIIVSNIILNIRRDAMERMVAVADPVDAGMRPHPFSPYRNFYLRCCHRL